MIIFKGVFIIFVLLVLNTSANVDQVHESTHLERLGKFRRAIGSLKNKNFNQIVTLGCNCLTKFRAMSFVENYGDGIKLCNHLFDWSSILNYSSFADAVRNNFTDVFGKYYLSVKPPIWATEGNVLHNDKYQMMFLHAIEKSPTLTRKSFRKYEYSLIESKFNHLTENSQKALTSGHKTLYLVYASYPSYPEGQTQQDFLNLLSAIKSMRDDNFLLLVLVSTSISSLNHYDYDVIIRGNLCFHLIDDYQYEQWHDGPSVYQWDELLKIVFENSKRNLSY